jgi:hypothetical protein
MAAVPIYLSELVIAFLKVLMQHFQKQLSTGSKHDEPAG